MARDWLGWHAGYDDPGSSLARRLAVVQGYLERALTEAPGGPDPSTAVRACLAEHGFREMAFARPDDARFRVGMHRLAGDAAPARRLSGARLFAFA